MSRQIGEWPPDTPGITNFLEFSDQRDLKWFAAKYWKTISLWGMAAGIFGFVLTHFFPPLFSSEARVRFMPPQVAGRFVNPNFSMEVEQRLFALNQLLSSRLTATKLIESLSLYPERRRFQTVADLVPTFLEDLRVMSVGNAETGKPHTVPTLNIQFQYTDPEKAQKVVQKLIEQVYEENSKYRGDQSLGTTDFLADQLTAAEDTMLEAEAHLGEIQDQIGSNVSQTKMGQATSRSYVVDSRLRDIRHDRRLLEERRSTKKAEFDQLEQLHKRIEVRPLEAYAAEVETIASQWHMRDKLYDATVHANRMREKWAPGFADVVRAEEDQREAERNIQRFTRDQATRFKQRDLEANAAKLALARLELQALDMQSLSQAQEENELKAEAQRLRDQQSPAANQETDLLTAKREYEIAKEHYTELQKKHDESHAASEMERRGQGETVELLEPASLPTTAFVPKRWLRVAFAFLLGLIWGTLLSLARVIADPKILHAGHIEKWAGLPVMASFEALSAIQKPRKRVSSPPRGGPAVAFTMLAMMILSGCADSYLSARSLWSKGVAAQKEGRSAAAMIYFQQALRKDARFAPAYDSSARLALELGELLPAREYLARAVELSPNDSSLRILLADTSYQVYFADPGRPTALLREVEAQAEELRKRWPGSPDGYRILSQVLMERHRTDEAVSLLRDASAKVKNSETLRAQMAAALFRTGKVEDSATVLWDLIESTPGYSDAYDILYLQLMQRQNRDGAREVLVRKWANTQQLDSALQLAAHDDAQGQRQTVVEFLNSVAPTAAKLPLGLARIGDFWMHRTQWELAKSAYEKGGAGDSQHFAEYTGRMAEWFLAQNKKTEARQLVESEFANHKSSALLEAYVAAIRLGEMQAERRQDERKRLESILLRMPDSPFVRYHLGRAYMLEKKLQPAAEQFERCIKLDANYAPGWVALAEMEISRSNANAAKQRADMVLRQNPNYLPAILVSARAQAQRGQFSEARKSLEQVLAAQPSNRDALYWLGSTYADQNRSEEARKIFAEGRELEPQNSRWVLGEVGMLRAQNKTAAARQTLESAINKGLNSEDAIARLAEIQIAQQDGPAAIRTFTQLAAQHPQNKDYKLGLAGSSALAGDREKALQLYSELQKLAPDDVRVWLQPAVLLGEMGRTEQALSHYEEALKRDKSNPIVLNNIAWMLLRQGSHPEKALEYAQNAKRIVQRAPEIDDTLAEAYTKLSMHRSAVAVYEEMLSYVPAEKKSRIKKLLDEARQRSARGGDA